MIQNRLQGYQVDSVWLEGQGEGPIIPAYGQDRGAIHFLGEGPSYLSRLLLQRRMGTAFAITAVCAVLAVIFHFSVSKRASNSGFTTLGAAARPCDVGIDQAFHSRIRTIGLGQHHEGHSLQRKHCWYCTRTKAIEVRASCLVGCEICSANIEKL